MAMTTVCVYGVVYFGSGCAECQHRHRITTEQAAAAEEKVRWVRRFFVRRDDAQEKSAIE
jgi:hypothetical protein